MSAITSAALKQLMPNPVETLDTVKGERSGIPPRITVAKAAPIRAPYTGAKSSVNH